jgi:hypothetical protein
LHTHSLCITRAVIEKSEIYDGELKDTRKTLNVISGEVVLMEKSVQSWHRRLVSRGRDRPCERPPARIRT